MNLSLNKNYITIIGFLITIGFAIYGLQSGIFTSQQQMELFLSQAGILAPLIFILIQIVQCVIPIIPGGVSCLIGVVVFGPVYGFIYNYVGICIGSTINYLIAKEYGKDMILKLISKQTYEKYVSWIEKGKKFDKLFALAIFLPCAPDDALCLIAGLTPMSLKKFIVIILTCKPWSILAYSIGLSKIFEWIMSFL